MKPECLTYKTILYVTAAPLYPTFWCANDFPWNLLADVYGYAAAAAMLPGAEEAAGVESRL